MRAVSEGDSLSRALDIAHARMRVLALSHLAHPGRRLDPDDMSAKPVGQQLGPGTDAGAEVEDVRPATDVTRQRLQPQLHEFRVRSASGRADGELTAVVVAPGVHAPGRLARTLGPVRAALAEEALEVARDR